VAGGGGGGGPVGGGGGGGGATRAGTLVLTLTLATWGDEAAPETAPGTVPVTLPSVDAVLFEECPRKYAPANAAAPMTAAITRILTGVLILEARL
jgi:hypothetical protein